MPDVYVEMVKTDCRNGNGGKQTDELQACQVRDDSAADQVISEEGR